MTQPVIITVAITEAGPRKKDNAAVPVTPFKPETFFDTLRRQL